MLREAYDGRAVPARLARRRQEPQRDSARRGRRSARSRATRRARSGPRSSRRPPIVRDAYAKTDPGATVTVESAGDAADAWTEEATAHAARRRRGRPDRAARDEPRLRRARRDEHVARRGDDRGRHAHAAQPLALVERRRDARGDRRARRRRPPRRRRARGEVQLQRLAPRPRLARAVGCARASTSGSSASRRWSRRSTPGSRPRSSARKVSGRLDMLAIGPQIEGPHSPDERVSIPTVRALLEAARRRRRRAVRAGGVDVMRGALVWIVGDRCRHRGRARRDGRDRQPRQDAVRRSRPASGRRASAARSAPGAARWRRSSRTIRTPAASASVGVEEPQSETPQGRTGFVRAGLERSVRGDQDARRGHRQRRHPRHAAGRAGGATRVRLGGRRARTTSRTRRTRSTRRPTRSRTRSAS